jgi:ABC-type dipeptide/oligopeptide/nickel transport system ATPase component
VRRFTGASRYLQAPESRLKSYPHQLRRHEPARDDCCITARNLDLLIADEPTTALTRTIQAQILDLLRSLQKNAAWRWC